MRMALFLGRAAFFFAECHRRACEGLMRFEALRAAPELPFLDPSPHTIAVLAAVAMDGSEGIRGASLRAQLSYAATHRIVHLLASTRHVTVARVDGDVQRSVRLTKQGEAVVERYCALYESAARDLATTWGLRLADIKRSFARVLADVPRKATMADLRRNGSAAKRKSARGFDVRDGAAIKRGVDRFNTDRDAATSDGQARSPAMASRKPSPKGSKRRSGRTPTTDRARTRR